MPVEVIGWDIGGAHVKAAVVDQKGIVKKVIQEECPLWKGLPSLRKAISRILSIFDGDSHNHAITMTGELVDLFTNRPEGVDAILNTITAKIPSKHLYVFAGRNGFVRTDRISQHDYEAIASANWLTTGSWVAKEIEAGLLIDIGSTTTDIIPIKESRVTTVGYTDYERLCCDELVYTGIVRTPIVALTDRVPFEGNSVGLVAEVFATTADIYRLTGELPEYADQMPAADNGRKTVQESARRLARMIGRDLGSADLPRWRTLANHLRNLQLARIWSACEKQFSRDSCYNKSLIGTGIGRFLVEEMARRLKYPYIDFNTLFPHELQGDFQPADCAPAVCLASLLNKTLCP